MARAGHADRYSSHAGHVYRIPLTIRLAVQIKWDGYRAVAFVSSCD